MHERKSKLAGIVISIALVAALALVLVNVPSSLWSSHPQHNNIRDLEVLPLGPVRLEGVVTYVDRVNKRFWLQDDTGAIAIGEDANAKVTAGQQ